jgi:hypothetical protein
MSTTSASYSAPERTLRTPSGPGRALRLGAGAVVLAGALAAALAPPGGGAREALFEIPHGTFARPMAGEPLPNQPDEIRLTLGLRDVLVLRNRDDVPQIFGPTLIMPGQSLRLPFRKAASYQFACLAHASGQLTITVEPYPRPGWMRLTWRAREWWWHVRAGWSGG